MDTLKRDSTLDGDSHLHNVHVQDTGAVESVDNVLRWDTDGGDEELRAALDNDI